MSAVRDRIAAPIRSALANTERRKRAIVALAAAPLALVFGAGAGFGALANAGSWSALVIVAVLAAVLAVALAAARALLAAAQSIRRRQTEAWIPEKLRPLRVAVSTEAPMRVNIVHPSIDVKHFFGGFIAVFNLARRLVERGHRVRMIALEHSALPSDWRRRIAGYEGLAGVLDRIEVSFAAAREPLEISPSDGLIATHWTAAHVAHGAATELADRRFLYLIQEYEPFIFPMGSAAALARQSYELPHTALFSTELLREYFAAHRIGVFAGGEDAGLRASLSFDNAITPVGPVSAGDLRRDGPPRLLFYARPEQHAMRNLFEIGVLALDDAAAAGHLDGWELAGIGSVEPGARRMRLARSGASVKMIPRRSQGDYASLLRSFDLGLALMYTPHPSLVPIEMAFAGMTTVTNTFENKDERALAAISTNLIAAEPSVEGVSAAIAAATARSAELDRRAAGSRISWPVRWDDALDEGRMGEIEHLLALR